MQKTHHAGKIAAIQQSFVSRMVASHLLLSRKRVSPSFTSPDTDAWRQQGYEDTMLAMEHIRKPLAARQALTRSEAVLQKSLDITEEADLALRNAMARIK